MKKIISLLSVLCLVLALTACGAGSGGEKPAEETKGAAEEEQKDEAEQQKQEEQKDQQKDQENTDKSQEEQKGENDMANHPVVTISTKIGDKDLADMKLELYPEKAPNTVANFVSLAQDGYYDGLGFHRIISGFMIQGGDPQGTGMGGPGYGIFGEFASNGFASNDIQHKRGVISMARSQMPNSAGSQFFICHKDALFLDGEYAAFGALTEGEESLDALAEVETGPNDKPAVACVITKMTVELNGYEVPEVEKN